MKAILGAVLLVLGSLSPGCIYLGAHKDANLQLSIRSYRDDDVTLGFAFARGGEVVANRSYDLAPNAAMSPPRIPLPYGEYEIMANAAGLAANLTHWLDSETKGITVMVGEEAIQLLRIG